jgi:hypothetical protein
MSMTTQPGIRKPKAGRRTLALFLAFAAMVLSISLGGAAKAQAAPINGTPVTTTKAAKVSGHLANGEGDVAGRVTVKWVKVSKGKLVAVGTFKGKVTNEAGIAKRATQAVTLPVDVAATADSCPILNLVLGPLDLNLLGLVVHLDKVVLDITAEPGPGNLLGNLLCAVAGLLDGNATGLNGLLNQLVAAFLNQLLGALG